ncbi:hypothetical protein [Streptomyces sp. enrichment culture]|uniref:hypothetical protein n=1 Tax=Streptomyces sp. enrichment culture TaxID=1795815 RepID=UPI003F568D4F
MAVADAQNARTPPTAAVSPADTADFWFELPPGFVQIDLREDAKSRLLRMTDVIDALFADAAPQQKFNLVASSEYILQTMIASGAEHISSCLLRMRGNKLSQGTLCVLVERPDTGPQSQDRQGSAKRTAALWRRLYPDAEVGLVMLPYGISALCIRDQDLEVPGIFFGLDEPIPALVREVQFNVPLANGPGSVLFVFMTQDIEHWDEYLEMLGGIMKSISADEPHEGETSESGSQGVGGSE